MMVQHGVLFHNSSGNCKMVHYPNGLFEQSTGMPMDITFQWESIYLWCDQALKVEYTVDVWLDTVNSVSLKNGGTHSR